MTNEHKRLRQLLRHWNCLDLFYSQTDNSRRTTTVSSPASDTTVIVTDRGEECCAERALAC